MDGHRVQLFFITPYLLYSLNKGLK